MSGLLGQESAADSYYNFPAGTLEALGTSESSQGTNLGTIGNIFQVVPSTASNPGYGLSGVDGNSPMSVGAYLYALEQKAGSLIGGISLYQGGAAPNTAMASFESGLGGTANPAAPTTSWWQSFLNATGYNTAQTMQQQIAGQGGAPAGSTLAFFQSLIPNAAFRGFIGVLALIMLVVGLAALALKSEPGQIVKSIAEKAP